MPADANPAATTSTEGLGLRRSRRPSAMNVPTHSPDADTESEADQEEALAPLTASGKRGARSKGPVRRKTSHSVIERRRREKINEKLIRLQNIVPTCREEAMELLTEKMSKSSAGRKGKQVAKGELDKVVGEKMVCEKLCIISHTVDFLEELLRQAARYKEAFGSEPRPISPSTPPLSPGALPRSHHAEAHTLAGEPEMGAFGSDLDLNSRSRKASDASSTSSNSGATAALEAGRPSSAPTSAPPARIAQAPKAFKRKRHWGSNRIPKSAKCCHEPSCAAAPDVIETKVEERRESGPVTAQSTPPHHHHHHHHHHRTAETEGDESDSEDELAFEDSCPSTESGAHKSDVKGPSWMSLEGIKHHVGRQAAPPAPAMGPFDMSSLTRRPQHPAHERHPSNGFSSPSQRHSHPQDVNFPPASAGFQAPHQHQHTPTCMRGIDVLATVCCGPGPHEVADSRDRAAGGEPSSSLSHAARHSSPVGARDQAFLRLAPMRGQHAAGEGRDDARSGLTLPPLRGLRPLP